MINDMLNVVGVGSRGLPPTLKFLFKLAWESRIRLPLLLTLGFMITNRHYRLEINIGMNLMDDGGIQNNALGMFTL